jgi:GAF domain-containing protein
MDAIAQLDLTAEAEPAEVMRVRVLESLGLTENAEDPRYARLCELAAREFGVPIALISLVYQDRQWFKARFGFTAQQTHRTVSFCSHAIRRPEVFVVEDAAANPLFADNPLVNGYPHIRFYAGAPLQFGPDCSLGTLCVIDRSPRRFNEGEKLRLGRLARRVVDLIWAEGAMQDPEFFMIP